MSGTASRYGVGTSWISLNFLVVRALGESALPFSGDGELAGSRWASGGSTELLAALPAEAPARKEAPAPKAVLRTAGASAGGSAGGSALTLDALWMERGGNGGATAGGWRSKRSGWSVEAPLTSPAERSLPRLLCGAGALTAARGLWSGDLRPAPAPPPHLRWEQQEVIFNNFMSKQCQNNVKSTSKHYQSNVQTV